MASTAGLRADLLTALAGELAPAGFHKSEQSFRKPWGEARLTVHVSFIKRASDFDATIDVAVRHNPVEDCLNANRSDLSSREKAQTSTVGVELGNWSIRRPHRWTVGTSADVLLVADSIMNDVRRVGFPFLERFGSLAEVGRVLDLDGEEARLICPLPEKRAAVRIIIHELLSGAAR
jgi:hypothetical protein